MPRGGRPSVPCLGNGSRGSARPRRATAGPRNRGRPRADAGRGGHRRIPSPRCRGPPTRRSPPVIRGARTSRSTMYHREASPGAASGRRRTRSAQRRTPSRSRASCARPRAPPRAVRREGPGRPQAGAPTSNRTRPDARQRRIRPLRHRQRRHRMLPIRPWSSSLQRRRVYGLRRRRRARPGFRDQLDGMWSTGERRLGPDRPASTGGT